MVKNRKAERKAENIDILIGLLGFFAAVLVVVTIIAQLSGEPAVGWALLLLLLVLIIWLLVKKRLGNPDSGRGDRHQRN
ncbi:hypothetical protein [Arthrobacter sp. H14]|uniref:hypothetical protein n=1 Tax=Arthrobacter sp. H14 TaxID=1312959 RepID=UPI0004B290AD|nr:hypothetical protein [Arthrobacter sp. H14]